MLVQHLQRTQEAVAGVLGKCQFVAPAADKPIFGRKAVIEGVQLFLLCLNVLVRVSFGLILNQPADTFPQLDHTPDTVFRCNRNLHRVHEAVFTVVHLTVHNRVAEIPNSRVCGDGTIFLLVRFFLYIGLDLGLKKLDGLGKLLRQVSTFAGFAGAVHSESCGFHHHIAQNHFRVLHKVAVHADAIFIGVQLHPILLQIGDVISFLQEQNIAGDFRSGILLECVVR